MGRRVRDELTRDALADLPGLRLAEDSERAAKRVFEVEVGWD